MRCQVCGTKRQTADIFCGECGARLPTPEQRAWQIALAVVALLIAGGLAYALHRELDAPGEQLRQRREAVAAAMRAVSEAEAEAFSRDDPGPLFRTHLGDALRLVLDEAGQLQQAGLRRVTRLQSQTIANITFAPGDRIAIVELTERWQTALYYRSTGACQRQLISRDLPQTAQLALVGDQWMLQSFRFADLRPPQWAPCR